MHRPSIRSSTRRAGAGVLPALLCIALAASASCTTPRSPLDRRESDVRGVRRTARDAGSAARDASATPLDADAPDSAAEDSSAGDGGEGLRCGDGKVTGDERCDVAIKQGDLGACPTRCERDRASPCARPKLEGTECEAHCESTIIKKRVAGDGCCPAGASSADDDDCRPSCGNKVIERGETCDPPSSCPSCQDGSNPCLRATSRGSIESCNVECVNSELRECRADDACCPSGCTTRDDSDCSTRCGDGVVESSAGETCEADGDSPCPASCDDGDACTDDVRSGSDDNCNVTCSHARRSTFEAGDGCCPSGGNAAVDSDCAPVCGNLVVEGDEACDDGNLDPGDGCNAQCAFESTSEQCLASRAAMGGSESCNDCVCERCSERSCFVDFDREQTAGCERLVRCMRDSGCSGLDCYCANDLLGCAVGFASGPCREEVERAADSMDPFDIAYKLVDTANPSGRAASLRGCEVGRCAEGCD